MLVGYVDKLPLWCNDHLSCTQHSLQTTQSAIASYNVINLLPKEVIGKRAIVGKNRLIIQIDQEQFRFED